MILEKIRRNKFRTLLIVVVLGLLYWRLVGWTLPTRGDLQFAEIECGVASTKDGVDRLNYSVKVINAGPTDVPARFYQIFAEIDGETHTIDRDSSGAHSTTYGGSFEVKAVKAPAEHQVKFVIKANDRDQSNNSAIRTVPGL